MTNSIISKWGEQKFCVRFVNGDTHDSYRSNIQVVSLKRAMENIYVWTEDWDLNLMHEETQVVQCPAWLLWFLEVGKYVENEVIGTQSFYEKAYDANKEFSSILK
jgi:hypothetical protein